MHTTIENHQVAIARETINVAAMSDENVREGFLLWMVRAGQCWTAYGMAMLNLYTNEYIRRGLNK